MAKETLLLADNFDEYLDTTRQQLTAAGYKVVCAKNSRQARNILRSKKRIDLAVLDLRLENDKDEHDISGLIIAKEIARLVPKVIVSNFPSNKVEEEVGKLSAVDGLPSVVRFVNKEDGFEALLNAIEEGLALKPYFQRALSRLTNQLDSYYTDARDDAKRFGWVALGASIIGIPFILYAVTLALQGRVEIALSTAVAGMILEATGLLAFRRSDIANQRSDSYHSELLEIHQFEILLAACNALDVGKEQSNKEKVIAVATTFWLSKSDGERLSTDTSPGIFTGQTEGGAHDPANPTR